MLGCFPPNIGFLAFQSLVLPSLSIAGHRSLLKSGAQRCSQGWDQPHTSVDPSSSQVVNKQCPVHGKESVHTSHFIVIVVVITIYSSCLIYR